MIRENLFLCNYLCKNGESFLADYNRLKTLLLFKERFKTALKEIRQIQRGEKQGTSLNDFLNKL
jgi:hypothetical protein